MTIPPSGAADGPNAQDDWTADSSDLPRDGWTALAPDAKGERLLQAAAEVFARRGLDAPMSEIAQAAGTGVASVYRRFPSKRDLLAALVVRRMNEIATAARAAEASDGDRWTALTAMLRTLVEHQGADVLLGEARAAVQGHARVAVATERATAALDGLLAAARAEGRLRSDATTLDVRLLFAATRAARQIEPDRWRRVLELLLDALDARPSPRARGDDG